MVGKKIRLLAAVAAVLVVAAACSSSSKSSSSSNTSAAGGTTGATTAGNSLGGSATPGKTINVGILTDLTGPGANISSTFPQGVKAGIGLAAKDGYTIKYVTADTGTSPTGGLAA